MAGFDDSQALDYLTQLAGKSIDPSGFRTALSEVMPGWAGNADPMKGYPDPAQHGRIAAARALFEVVPAPFNAASGVSFEWGKDHGFGPALAYAGQSSRTPSEVKAWLDTAVAHQQDVVGNG